MPLTFDDVFRAQGVNIPTQTATGNRWWDANGNPTFDNWALYRGKGPPDSPNPNSGKPPATHAPDASRWWDANHNPTFDNWALYQGKGPPDGSVVPAPPPKPTTTGDAITTTPPATTTASVPNFGLPQAQYANQANPAPAAVPGTVVNPAPANTGTTSQVHVWWNPDGTPTFDNWALYQGKGPPGSVPPGAATPQQYSSYAGIGQQKTQPALSTSSTFSTPAQTSYQAPSSFAAPQSPVNTGFGSTVRGFGQ